MPRERISVSVSMPWLSHDAWSQTYVGTHKLIYRLLPESTSQLEDDESSLCQLALIGANHLMEIALAKVLAHCDPTLKSKESKYYFDLTNTFPSLTGKAPNLLTEPFRSTEKLRIRRNKTVHASSAVASVEMARSALFSATQGSRALFEHVCIPFPYERFLAKRPMPDESPYFDVPHAGT